MLKEKLREIIILNSFQIYNLENNEDKKRERGKLKEGKRERNTK